MSWATATRIKLFWLNGIYVFGRFSVQTSEAQVDHGRSFQFQFFFFSFSRHQTRPEYEMAASNQRLTHTDTDTHCGESQNYYIKRDKIM